MNTLTYDQAKSYALAAIEEFGSDFVYNPDHGRGGDCFYVPISEVSELPESILNSGLNLSPKMITGCIVGRILSQAGVPNESMNSGTVVLPVRSLATSLQNKGILSTDEETREFLDKLQMFQDSGVSWGAAFDGAVVEI